jgi:superfamily II DNA or RNA helicase
MQATLNQQLSLFATVAHHFPAHIETRPYQVESVDTLAPLPRSGIYAEVGTGKTLMATAIALIKRAEYKCQTIVLMPPILLRQWKRWLDSLIGGFTSIVYAGSPKQRAQMNLAQDFILMSIQIFKKDYDRLRAYFITKPFTIIVDEATCIKNPGSDNYRKLRDFVNG